MQIDYNKRKIFLLIYSRINAVSFDDNRCNKVIDFITSFACKVYQ